MALPMPDLFAMVEATKRRKIVVCARALRALARRRCDFGVTATDTRRIAVEYGFCTGHERDHRATSWFSVVPVVARLRSTSRTRPGLNRNRHTVYVIP